MTTSNIGIGALSKYTSVIGRCLFVVISLPIFSLIGANVFADDSTYRPKGNTVNYQGGDPKAQWLTKNQGLASSATWEANKGDVEILSTFKPGAGSANMIRPLALDNGTIIVPLGATNVDRWKLYWLKEDSSVVHRYPLSGIVRSSPALLRDGTVVIGNTSSKHEPQSPSVSWVKEGIREHSVLFNASFSNAGSPAVLSDGTVVIGAIESGGLGGPTKYNLHWLKKDKKESIHKFEFELPSNAIGTIAPAVLEGDVVVLPADKNVYWLKDGKEIAKLKLDREINAPPIVLKDEIVVVGSTTSAHNVKDAKVFWLKRGEKPGEAVKKYEFNIGAPVFSAPALLEDDVVVVAAGNSVHWLKNGKLLKRFYASEGFGSGLLGASSPAVYKDGTVVIGSQHAKSVFWLNYGELIDKFTQKIAVDAHTTFLTPAILPNGNIAIAGTGGGAYNIWWLGR